MAKKILTKEEKAARNKKRLNNYNPVAAARNAWRREFSRSPHVIELMNSPATKRYVPKFNKDGTRSTQDAVERLCSVCSKWKRNSGKLKFAVDHKDPVVDPVVGFVDFNTYFARMWCPTFNLQLICGECHSIKTELEWKVRRLKDGQEQIAQLELCQDKTIVKKEIKKYTPKRLAKLQYPKELVDRIIALKNRCKG